MKTITKTMNFVLSMVLLLGALVITNILTKGSVAYAAPAKFADAEEITLGKKYSGTMYKSGSEKQYSFTISESGKVNIYFTSENDKMKFAFYYGNGDAINNSIYNKAEGSKYAIDRVYYLKAGTYYLDTFCNSTTTMVESIPYTITVDFTPANESFQETQETNDDSFPLAHTIYFDKKYKGQYGLADSQDYFLLKVPVDGTITIDYESEKSYAAYIIYDSNQNKLEGSHLPSDKTSDSNKYTLKKGSYYIVMDYGSMTGENTDVDDWGFYNFKIKFKPSIKKAVITNATRKNANATIKYKKLSNITGYEISYSPTKKFSKNTAKVVTTKSLSKKISKLKSKNYYVRVRGYYTYRGKTYYGPYSAKKMLK